MIEKIATILPRDSDVRNLALTSTYFAAAILPSWSGVWRDRFLSLYDHPIIDHPDQFRFAYQIRRLTTKAFVSFEHGVDEQGLECLETLKDMVMGKSSVSLYEQACEVILSYSHQRHIIRPDFPVRT